MSSPDTEPEILTTSHSLQLPGDRNMSAPALPPDSTFPVILPGILLLHAGPDACPFVEELIQSHRRSLDITLAGNPVEAVWLLANGGFSAAILYLSGTGRSALDHVSILARQFPDVPILVVAEVDNDHAELEAMRLGAQEYLAGAQALGPPLVRAVRRAQARNAVAGSISERRSNQEQARLHAILENMP